MNQIKALPAKIVPALAVLKRYTAILFLVALAGIYGFLTFRINSLTQAEPSPDAVTEKLKTVTRPKVDQNAVDKMTELEEQNVEVQTLFQQARDNPFSE